MSKRYTRLALAIIVSICLLAACKDEISQNLPNKEASAAIKKADTDIQSFTKKTLTSILKSTDINFNKTIFSYKILSYSIGQDKNSSAKLLQIVLESPDNAPVYANRKIYIFANKDKGNKSWNLIDFTDSSNENRTSFFTEIKARTYETPYKITIK